MHANKHERKRRSSTLPPSYSSTAEVPKCRPTAPRRFVRRRQSRDLTVDRRPFLRLRAPEAIASSRPESNWSYSISRWCLDQYRHCHRRREQLRASLDRKPPNPHRPRVVESLETFRSTSCRCRPRYLPDRCPPGRRTIPPFLWKG